MAKPRTVLHNKLKAALGTNYVYYQPPSNIQMTYPCIIYAKDKQTAEYGSNIKYLSHDRYSVTVVDKNPDSSVVDDVTDIEYCEFESSYVSDNLYHTVFTIYN